MEGGRWKVNSLQVFESFDDRCIIVESLRIKDEEPEDRAEEERRALVCRLSPSSSSTPFQVPTSYLVFSEPRNTLLWIS